MAIFYSDGPREAGFPVDYHRMNACKHFVNHYSNWLQLDWIARKTKNFYEKSQAVKEMAIAERKMNYWKRHPNYEMETVLREVQKLKRQWGQGEEAPNCPVVL